MIFVERGVTVGGSLWRSSIDKAYTEMLQLLWNQEAHDTGFYELRFKSPAVRTDWNNTIIVHSIVKVLTDVTACRCSGNCNQIIFAAMYALLPVFHISTIQQFRNYA